MSTALRHSTAFDLAHRGQMLREGRTQLALRIQICQELVDVGRTRTNLFHHCVRLLDGVLRKSFVNPPVLNSHLVEALIHLGAVESVPVIARAFSTRRIDQSITGSWPLVQAKLGLIPYTTVRSISPEPIESKCSQSSKQWRAGDGFAPRQKRQKYPQRDRQRNKST